MPVLCRTALLIVVVTSGACGHRVAHVAPDESRPHVTWEIRAGGEAGDAELVCGSTRPSQRCVLTASTPDRQSTATVRLFLHAARRQTRYLGVMRVPFIEGAERLAGREVSATVPPDSQPVGASVSGPVTPTPGEYMFRVSLDAQEDGTAMAQRIEDEVPVSVRTSPSGRRASLGSAARAPGTAVSYPQWLYPLTIYPRRTILRRR